MPGYAPYPPPHLPDFDDPTIKSLSVPEVGAFLRYGRYFTYDAVRDGSITSLRVRGRCSMTLQAPMS